MSDLDVFLLKLNHARQKKSEAEDIEHRYLVAFVCTARSHGASIRDIARMADVSKSRIERLLYRIEKGEV